MFDIKFSNTMVKFFNLIFALFIIFLILFIINFSVSIVEYFSYSFFVFNKFFSNYTFVNLNFFSKFYDVSSMLFNANVDFDLSSNTDFENSLNVCNDCIEITHQDNFFLVSSIFFNPTNIMIISTSLLFFKILKNNKNFFFKNWKK